MRCHHPHPAPVVLLMHWVLLSLLSAGCALSQGVRPIGKGNVAIDASLGGPVANYMGGYKPLPLTMVGATYGLTERVNVHGGLYPTTLMLFGLVGGQGGASYLLLEQEEARPAIMVDGTLIAMGGNLSKGGPSGGFRGYLQTQAYASWAYGERGHLVYTGPEFLTQLAPAAAVPGWTVGHRAQWGRWGVGTEVGWLAPFWDNLPSVVEYAGIGGNGAISINLGVQVALGGGQQ